MTETLRAATVVVGGGPSGIAVACLLGEAGHEVLLVDEGARPGGQIWRHRQGTEPPPSGVPWLRRLSSSGARCLFGTSIVDASQDGTLLGERAENTVSIDYQNLVLATGARERFLPFPGWTLPGVIGVGAAQGLVKAGVEVEGTAIVLAGSGPLLLPVASLLVGRGAEVKIIAEQASHGAMLRFAAGLWRLPSKFREAVRYRAQTLRVPYRFGVWATAASGVDQVQEVELTDGRRTWTETCDWLCSSYGLVPNSELARLLGCEVRGESVEVDRFQRTNQPRIYCVGESTGIGGAELSLAEGRVAAAHILNQSADLRSLQESRDRLWRFAADLAATFEPRQELRDRVHPETLICRCEDVPWSSLDASWTARQAKLYTRLGMGPCQGRICGPAMRYLGGWESDTVRPPLKPSRIGTLGS